MQTNWIEAATKSILGKPFRFRWFYLNWKNLWRKKPRSFSNEHDFSLNPLSANPHKMVKLTQKFVGNLLTNCLSVFNHFVGFAHERLSYIHAFTFASSIVLFMHYFFTSRKHQVSYDKKCQLQKQREMLL